jgi:hypothetical protein
MRTLGPRWTKTSTAIKANNWHNWLRHTVHNRVPRVHQARSRGRIYPNRWSCLTNFLFFPRHLQFTPGARSIHIVHLLTRFSTRMYILGVSPTWHLPWVRDPQKPPFWGWNWHLEPKQFRICIGKNPIYHNSDYLSHLLGTLDAMKIFRGWDHLVVEFAKISPTGLKHSQIEWQNNHTYVVFGR